MPPRCAGSSSRTASAAPHARDPLRPDPATGPEPSAPCVVPRLPRVAIDRPCPAPPIRRPHRISPPNVGQAAGVCLEYSINKTYQLFDFLTVYGIREEFIDRSLVDRT